MLGYRFPMKDLKPLWLRLIEFLDKPDKKNPQMCFPVMLTCWIFIFCPNFTHISSSLAIDWKSCSHSLVLSAAPVMSRATCEGGARHTDPGLSGVGHRMPGQNQNLSLLLSQPRGDDVTACRHLSCSFRLSSSSPSDRLLTSVGGRRAPSWHFGVKLWEDGASRLLQDLMLADRHLLTPSHCSALMLRSEEAFCSSSGPPGSWEHYRWPSGAEHLIWRKLVSDFFRQLRNYFIQEFKQQGNSDVLVSEFMMKSFKTDPRLQVYSWLSGVLYVLSGFNPCLEVMFILDLSEFLGLFTHCYSQVMAWFLSRKRHIFK